MNLVTKSAVDAALAANVATLAGESADITAARAKMADSNLRVAKRERHMLIGQTVLGTVALSYDKAANTYTLSKGVVETSILLAQGAPRTVRPVLAALFTVA